MADEERTLSFTNILHIYGQPFEHECAFLVGDWEALMNLRDLITEALTPERKTNTWVETFTNDGEGYETHIVLVPSEKAAKIMLPYTDEANYRQNPPEAINPYDLVSHEHRKKLK